MTKTDVKWDGEKYSVELTPSARFRHFYKRKMGPLLSISIPKQIGSQTIRISFTQYGNKHLYSDVMGRNKFLQRTDLLSLDDALKKSRYVKTTPSFKSRRDGIDKFHYFETDIHGSHVYLNVAEKKNVGKDGHVRVSRFVYSITDKIQ
jgi:hypothetical protein